MIGYRGVLRALVGGSAALGGYTIAVRPRLLRWGATDDEAHRTLPGDELIPTADGQFTMATTLPAAPDQVWPWLAQMGCNRAGWYSWDRLDNFGRSSAERIVPDWQHLAEGDHLDAVPSGASWFSVALVDPPHHLVLRTHLTLPSGRVFDLHGPPPKAFTDGIWAFHLAPLPASQTRLLVRTRGHSRPHLLRAVDFLFWEPAHLIMQTRQFHNLRRHLTPAHLRRRPAPHQQLTPRTRGTRTSPAPAARRASRTAQDTPSRCQAPGSSLPQTPADPPLAPAPAGRACPR